MCECLGEIENLLSFLRPVHVVSLICQLDNGNLNGVDFVAGEEKSPSHNQALRL